MCDNLSSKKGKNTNITNIEIKQNMQNNFEKNKDGLSNIIKKCIIKPVSLKHKK